MERKQPKKRQASQVKLVRINKAGASGTIVMTDAFRSLAFFTDRIKFERFIKESLLNKAKKWRFADGSPVFVKLPSPITLKKGDVLHVVPRCAFHSHVIVFIGNKWIVKIPRRRVAFLHKSAHVTSYSGTIDKNLSNKYT